MSMNVTECMYKAIDPDVREKILGCLFGGAAGDALGYPVEFMNRKQISEKYGPEGILYYILKDGLASFTDDTQMLLFTLEGILLWRDKLKKRYDGAALKNSLYEAYRDWYFTQVKDDQRKELHKPCTQLYLQKSMHKCMAPGFTCIRSLRDKKKGSITNQYNESKGNGGVMRVAPIGFSFSREEYSLEDIMYMGAESAALTHGHPLGFISAGAMAGLINECIYGKSASLASAVRLSLDAVMKLFESYPAASELNELVTHAMALTTADGDDVTHIDMLGNSFCAESALAIAVYCAIKYEKDFDRAIQIAVNFDGDSDTVAAITGNILGAWKGVGCIDAKWTEPLHMDEYLEVLKYYF